MKSIIITIHAAAFLLAPTMASATTFSYYRSVFCDAQTTDFLIDNYTPRISLLEDTLCHQTPAGTMGIKLSGTVDDGCVVLAYEDYGCGKVIGSISPSGKCVGSTTARIGSWQASCNGTETKPETSTNTPTYMPGDVKRRVKNRGVYVPREDNVSARVTGNSSVTTTSTCTLTSDATLSTASSLASEISSGIAASVAVSVTGTDAMSLPSAEAALSSAIASGAGVAEGYSLTGYVSDVEGAVSATPNVMASKTPSVLVNGSVNGNGTVNSNRTLIVNATPKATHSGGVYLGGASGLEVLGSVKMVLGGLVAVAAVAFVL